METGIFQKVLAKTIIEFRDRIALESGDRAVSYGEFDERSDTIARWIVKNGFKKGETIGVLINDRLEFITAMIGIIKAGCVFVPLDSAYSRKRVKLILKSIVIGLVFYDKDNSTEFVTNDLLAMENTRFFPIADLPFHRGISSLNKKIDIHYSPEDKVYIYFTSGTTGEPKAILGRNKGLIHFINWETGAFGIDETFRFSQLTTPGFDVFLRDVLTPLSVGGAICIPANKETVLSGSRLVSWIRKNNIHLIHCVPSLFKLFNGSDTNKKKLAHLKYILLAGERVSPIELKKWYKNYGGSIQLVNLYGPTETTLAKVFYLIQEKDANKKVIPIGKPISGARVIILDEKMSICDELVVGELYIRTPYRSFGYCNDPELNNKKFIRNPFNSDPADMIYKTGDLGRYLPDGNIELIGRTDRQVKIRGMRIELEEIENVISGHPFIEEAVVVKKEVSEGNAFLVVYISKKNNPNLSDEDVTALKLKEYLSEELPAYMIPERVIELEKIPRKPNLKIDFDALSNLLQVAEQEYTPARNDIEHRLVKIWAGLLGIKKEKISVKKSFFEVGGNSLNVMSLISRIHRIFDTRISLGEIFANLTIEKQAKIIKGSGEEKFTPIEPSEKRDYYALSSAQKRLYVLHMMDPESTKYNLPAIMVLAGKLDRSRFKIVMQKLINRHESLRTFFRDVNGFPVQRVNEEVDFEIEYYIAAGSNNRESVQQEVSRFIRSFNLSETPLLRAGLIKIEQGKHVFMYDLHHIITDGTSRELLGKDFMLLYAGEEPIPLRIRYRDYSQWQDRPEQKEAMKQQEDYWLKEFAGEIPVFDLPTDYPRPVVKSFAGDMVNFEISTDVIERLKSMALAVDATLYMTLAAIYFVFLAKLSSREEILIGTPTAGRTHADLGDVIGMFINTLVLKAGPIGGMTFMEFLKEVKDKVLGAFENQSFQFENLVNKLALPRDVGRNPMFDMMFVFRNIEALVGEFSIETPGLKLSPWEYRTVTSKFDLNLQIIESGEKLYPGFEYSTELFKKETIHRFIRYFKNVISAILSDKERKIAEIELLTPEEKKELLFEFNDTSAAYRKDKTIHDLFMEQAKKTPDSTALVFENNRLSYGELNETSNRIAGLLRRKGVRSGAIIGIMAEPSIEMITGIFAVLKAGGAYLPIEPETPAERVNYMLADSKTAIMMTRGSLHGEFNFDGETVNIEDKSIYEKEPVELESINIPTDLLYLIYTSGTTGRPKGALLRHENLVNYTSWFAGWTRLSGDDKAVLTSSYAFDLGYTAIYPSILSGGELHLIPRDVYLSPETLLHYISTGKITYMKVTPTFFSIIVNCPDFSPELCRTLRLVVLGGEPVKVNDVELCHKIAGHVRVINHYGPTETTIGSAARFIDFTEFSAYRQAPSIGKPACNTRMYILDKYMQPLPIGSAGELWIGGDGVCSGYMNRPELTSEKFMPNPFLKGDRLYRTGDIAAWQPGGNIKLSGRTDGQVKIRGYRIELGAIESYLMGHESIRDAVVIDREMENGARALCAYFVCDEELPALRLREYLLKKAPEYMIPSYFVRLDEIPLGSHNKVDRKALPVPGSEPEAGYVAPGSKIEELLVETWEQVLGRKSIGINDNFFMIGGDSIKTIQIISRMNKAGYKLKMRDLFRRPSISALAPFVEKLERTADQSIISGAIPLTPIQERFFSGPEIDNHHYNLSVMLYSPERLEGKGIEEVVRKIQEHHDALRMTYNKVDGKIIQTNHGPAYPFFVQEHDLCNMMHEEAVETLERYASEIQASINTAAGPLMKTGLFHLCDGDRLLIVIHHLVIDGVSWRILFEDIESLYGQYKNSEPFVLPLKTDSYKKWAKRLPEYANNKRFLKEIDYWAGLGLTAAPTIIKDFPGENNLIKDADYVSFNLSEEETTNLLTKVNDPFGTEINDILLTALGMAFRETYGHDKVTIALEGHGREEIMKDINVSRTIGWFTSIFPVVLDMSYERNLSRQIKEVKEILRRVPNKGIGYGILRYLTADDHKEGLRFDRDPQISFNYLGQFDTDLAHTSFSVAAESAGRQRSLKRRRNYELEVSGMISGNRLTLSITFSNKQYLKKTVEKLTGCYKSALTRLISYCSSLKEKEYTPGDFTYKKLPIETLERLLSEYNVEDIYILTPMQEGMLFHTLFDKNTSAYFEQTSYRLKADLEVDIVKRSLNELFKRHDILRTAVVHEGRGIDRPVQLVLKDRHIDFIYEDLRGLGVENGDGEQEQYIGDFKEKDRQRSFDLGQDPLMRIAVLQAGDREYEFVWSHHHILMDGWCTGIIITEFFEIYNSFREKRPYKLAPVQPFRTYIEWLERRDEHVSEEYWTKYLAGYEQLTGVPKPGILPGSDTAYRNEHINFLYGKGKTLRLTELAGKYDVTLNTIVQAAWAIVLGKLNGKRDVVFGAVVSGRPSEIERVEAMVGLFINTIPIRIRCGESTGFSELLRQVQEEAVESERHHYFPLAEIQSHHPLKQSLLDHIVVFENYPLAEKIDGVMNNFKKNNESLTWELSNIDRFEQTNYDFNIIIGLAEQLNIIFFYNANRYEAGYLTKVCEYFKKVLDQVIDNPVMALAEFTILSEEERRQVLVAFNDTEADYPADKTLYELFEEQVEKTPESIALISADRQLSYMELNERAAHLAEILIKKGVGPNHIVGIMIKRSIEMMTGIFGILKSGGGYLPIDLDYPAQRVRFILADSGVKLLLSTRPLPAEAGLPGNLEVETVYLDEIEKLRVLPARENLFYSPANPAYVIYTSGSTGKPKGVIISHRSVINRLDWMQRSYPIGGQDVLLQKTPVVFDVSVWELFWWSFNGAALCLLGCGEEKNPEAIAAAIGKSRVTTMHFVPSMLNAFLEYLEDSRTFDHNSCAGLRQVFSSGEALENHQMTKFRQLLGRKNGTKLINLYGPTEATVDVSYFDCPTSGELAGGIPIGKPIHNIRLYIMDKNMNPQPIGIPGELCISGVGLARGYLNRPELTAGKFITKSAFEPRESGILYRTGDLARWLPDGNIDFMGRLDYQVKIRGNRVELGEIESRLAKHEGIKEAVVIDRTKNDGNDNAGEKYLCAYIIAASARAGNELNIPGLKLYLAETLPDYMVPSYFVEIEKIPLTINGKLDRKALETAGAMLKTDVEYVAPENEFERLVANAWQNVLKLDKVGIYDNFFDIGGDSLKAIRLNSKLNEALNRKISIVTLFENVTIDSFVRFLTREPGERGAKDNIDRSVILEKVKQTRTDRRKKRKKGSLNV
jgi:iturin family lipopeptide synthetase B